MGKELSRRLNTRGIDRALHAIANGKKPKPRGLDNLIRLAQFAYLLEALNDVDLLDLYYRTQPKFIYWRQGKAPGSRGRIAIANSDIVAHQVESYMEAFNVGRKKAVDEIARRTEMDVRSVDTLYYRLLAKRKKGKDPTKYL